MKFKLCETSDPFISALILGFDFHLTAKQCQISTALLADVFTSLMKSPMSPGWGAADLIGYCGSGWRGLSSRRRIPTGLMASGSIVSGCWS